MALPSFPWFSSAQKARRRAEELADNDFELLETLVRIRQDRGMTQAQVAELLGITQQAVSKVEHPGADPRLSTIRQYAHAIGALVQHVAVPDEGQLDQGHEWVEISFAPRASETAMVGAARQISVIADRMAVSLAA